MARPSSDIRLRILTTARELFWKTGVDGTSMRQIAKAAGTSVAMVSYHFDSKDGLFKACVDDVYDRFVGDLEAVAATHSDPLERLRALLTRMSAIHADERVMVLIVVREASIQSDRFQYILGRFFAGHGRLLMAALAEGMERGQIRPMPLPLSLPVIIAPIIFPQLMIDALAHATGVPIALEPGLALDLMLHGLLPRPAGVPEV